MPVSFKLTEAERDLVDSLRGETERSVWLREAAMEAARRNSGMPKPAPRTVPPERVAELRAMALAADIDPVSDPVELARRGIEARIAEIAAQSQPAKECKHKGLRMAKGVCPDCSTYVTRKP